MGKYLFFTLFAVGVLIYFRIRFLLKIHNPETYQIFFGKSIIDRSMNDSFSFVKFSLFGSNWSQIKNKKLIFWLKIYRIISIIYYAIGVFAFLYILYSIVKILIY